MLDHASRAICAVIAFAKIHQAKGFDRIDVLIECEDRDEDILIDIADTNNHFKSCAVSFVSDDENYHNWYVFEMRDGQMISYECEYLNDNEAWPKYLERFATDMLVNVK